MNAIPTRCRLSPTLMGLVLIAMAAPHSRAQLTPDRTYYGMARAIPMTIAVPDGRTANLSVSLLAAVTGDEIASADVLEGAVDLAGLFPMLWEDSEPDLMYAQLHIGSERVGPAVVLQPMITPKYATRVDENPIPVYARHAPGSRVFSGFRAYPEKHVVLETDRGDIEFRMRPDHAPNTVWNFLSLVRGGFYTDITFHRIVAQANTRFGPRPFVIQMGDPLGVGSGGPGYFIDLEPSLLPHDFGVISMARSDDPNSNSSQVFICLSREGTQALDNRYTSFGEAVAGADVIIDISKTPQPQVPGDEPTVDPPVIMRAYLVDAPPYGQGPDPAIDPAVETPR